MTPRNTKQGASASTRRGSKGSARPVSSSHTPKPKTASPVARRVVARWWMLPVIVLAVLGFFVATYYPVAKVQYRETREKTRLQAQLTAIEERNARLQVAVDRLKTPEGVEDYARLQLGMVKQGEHVAVVIDGDESTQTALSAPASPRVDSEEAAIPPVGPWTAFLDVVFDVE